MSSLPTIKTKYLSDVRLFLERQPEHRGVTHHIIKALHPPAKVSLLLFIEIKSTLVQPIYKFVAT